MDKTELQNLIEQFINTLPDDRDIEWFSTDRGVGRTVLNAFLWWLYPELRPKDLPPWTLWPLRDDEDDDAEPPSFAWLAGHSTVGEYQERKRQQCMRRNFQRLYAKDPGTDPISTMMIRMYEWRCDEHLWVRVTGVPVLVVVGDQSWFRLAVLVEGQNWIAVYNEDTLRWESGEVGPGSKTR